MKIFIIFSYLIIFAIISSCSKKVEKITVLKEKNLETQMIEVYNQAMSEFERGDVIYAGKKFGEAELLYPQSNHPQTDYAYYLLALCHYNQIVDEKKDFNEILLAKKYFQFLLKNFPQTDYALDSQYKLEYIVELMASKEMYLARYYTEREKWIPAINRFKLVVNEYDNTIYIEEALHRLVELHYKIGLEGEAKKYASLLGYNYRSSQWYEESYKLINKNYVRKKIDKKDQRESILKKFRNLFR